MIASHWVRDANTFITDYTLSPGVYQWTLRPFGPSGYGLRSAPAAFAVTSASDEPLPTIPERYGDTYAAALYPHMGCSGRHTVV